MKGGLPLVEMAEKVCWRQYCPIGSHLNFFGRAGEQKKCHKMHLFVFGQIEWDFATASYIQGTTIWNLTSWRFRKCGTYWVFKFLNGSYCWSKLEDSEILAPLAKIRGRKKKVTLTISKIKSCHQISLETTLFHLRWFNMKPQFCFLNAWLFFSAPFPTIFFYKFDPTSTAINRDLNHVNHHVPHIFWKLRPCSFTWSYPG